MVSAEATITSFGLVFLSEPIFPIAVEVEGVAVGGIEVKRELVTIDPSDGIFSYVMGQRRNFLVDHHGIISGDVHTSLHYANLALVILVALVLSVMVQVVREWDVVGGQIIGVGVVLLRPVLDHLAPGLFDELVAPADVYGVVLPVEG